VSRHVRNETRKSLGDIQRALSRSRRPKQWAVRYCDHHVVDTGHDYLVISFSMFHLISTHRRSADKEKAMDANVVEMDIPATRHGFIGAKPVGASAIVKPSPKKLLCVTSPSHQSADWTGTNATEVEIVRERPVSPYRICQSSTSETSGTAHRDTITTASQHTGSTAVLSAARRDRPRATVSGRSD
jgi:hypothetical protein